MKRICFVLGMLFLFVFFASSVLAKEIWIIEDEGLVSYQREENCPIYPIPPEGLSVEIAGKLIREEIPKYVIEKDKEIKWTLKPFWHLRKIEIIPRTEISYSAGAWISKEIPPQKTEKTDWILVVGHLLIPGIGILMVSVTNQKSKFGDKKLFVFYGMFFILIIFGVLICSFLGKLVGALIGMFAGIFLGIYFGTRAAGGFSGMLYGAIAYGFIGTFTEKLLTGGLIDNIVIIREYSIFIAFVCCFSFIAAKAIKRLWPVIVIR